MRLLLLLLAFQHMGLPKPPDIPPAHGKQERTVFYDKDHKPCATLVENDNKIWHVQLVRDGIVSQQFHTRKDAAQWAQYYCPVTK